MDLVLVRDSLCKVIDKVLNSFNTFLCVRFDRAFLSKKKYSSFYCFDKQNFKDAVNFILFYAFVSFCGIMFQQVKGVPVGVNYSPLLADIFLIFCEFSFMQKLMKEKKIRISKKNMSYMSFSG